MATHLSQLAIRSLAVILPEKTEAVAATLLIQDGKILSVSGYKTSPPAGFTLVDAGKSLVMPGLVDTHVHMNEPGRTEWEGFETATRAAAAGGITTVIDMPLNSIPPTTTLEGLELKIKAAVGHSQIDTGFWGGVVPGNVNELQKLIDAGVMGFKAFLIDSGVSEFPMATESVLRESLPILARAGLPLLVHAELESPVTYAASSAENYVDYLHSRPQKWEVDAVRLVIRLARETGCRIHIVHLSAADAIAEIRAAKSEKLPLTAETCPHYLSLHSEEIPRGATQFKCAPPIRELSNCERLWMGLRERDLDFIVSDHSPCTPSLKKMESGNFGEAWGGIAGLQFGLSVVWTEMHRRGLSLTQLSQWMSRAPAKFLGLEKQKGSFIAGADADLVIWEPEESFTLEASMIYHRHRVTPYLGKTFMGVVKKTYSRGYCVYDSGTFGAMQGQPLYSHSKPRRLS